VEEARYQLILLKKLHMKGFVRTKLREKFHNLRGQSWSLIFKSIWLMVQWLRYASSRTLQRIRHNPKQV